MFAMATMRGVHVVDATLSRPYLFFLTSIVAGTWGFLALCSVVWAALWILSRVSVKKDQNTERDPEPAQAMGTKLSVASAQEC